MFRVEILKIYFRKIFGGEDRTLVCVEYLTINYEDLMTIITHLKITFTITFLSGLIYWNLLNFSFECECISSFEVVPKYFLLTLSKIQFLKNHLPRDNKLTLKQSPSGLSIGVETLIQRHKILGCLDIVLSISAKNVCFIRISSIKTKTRLHHDCS